MKFSTLSNTGSVSQSYFPNSKTQIKSADKETKKTNGLGNHTNRLHTSTPTSTQSMTLKLTLHKPIQDL